ncbi:MAG TPA: FAD-dependent oxidoreductase, partial [Nevskia sp.]|nr:FAD-dependent oxidoreductase [Nevskia sp.]
MDRKKVVVIGNGMVGHKLLEQLVAAAAELEITVLCEEPRPAYDRVHLSEFFAGKSADELSLVASGFFESNGNLLLKLNAKAVQIDRAAKTVSTSGGETLPYDALVLATGSYPFVPPLPGKDRPACL